MRALAIVEETWREAWAKKTSIVLAALVLVILLLFAFAVGVSETEFGDPELIKISIFGLEVPEPLLKSSFTSWVGIAALSLLNPWGIFLALFITVGLFPSMLRKGRIDLLLSKPITRYELYLSHLLGVLSLVFVTTMAFALGIWLLVWLKAGIANVGLLLAGLLILFIFLAFYSLAQLLALLTESTGFTLVVTFVTWGLAELVYYRELAASLSKSLGKVAGLLYYLLPKTNDLEVLATKLVGMGEMMEREMGAAGGSIATGWFPIWSSALFVVGMLGVGVYLFSRKSY